MLAVVVSTRTAGGASCEAPASSFANGEHGLCASSSGARGAGDRRAHRLEQLHGCNGRHGSVSFLGSLLRAVALERCRSRTLRASLSVHCWGEALRPNLGGAFAEVRESDAALLLWQTLRPKDVERPLLGRAMGRMLCSAPVGLGLSIPVSATRVRRTQSEPSCNHFEPESIFSLK